MTCCIGLSDGYVYDPSTRQGGGVMTVQEARDWLDESYDSRLLVVTEETRRVFCGDKWEPYSHITTSYNLHGFMYDDRIEEVMFFNPTDILLTLAGMLPEKHHGAHKCPNRVRANKWRNRVSVYIQESL